MISIDKILKEYLGESELKDMLHVILGFIEKVGWTDMNPWTDFFAVFKPPQLNAKKLEQRIVSNFIQYRSNYIIISIVICLISLLFHPILLISLIALGIFTIYFTIYVKTSIKVAEVTITTKGKRYICLGLLILILGLTGGITRIVWDCIYCLFICIIHMLLRPRSVSSAANKAYEDVKAHGFSFWAGSSTLPKSDGEGNDPENPPDRGDHDVSGYGVTAETMRKRNFLSVNTPQN